MVFRNNKGEDKLIIDSDLVTNSNFSITIESFNETDGIVIKRKDNEKFNIVFDKEHIFVFEVSHIIYDQTNERMGAFSSTELITFSKNLKQLELAIVRLENDNIIISTIDIPMRRLQQNVEDTYPKFDISVSDCVYSMKIYLNDDRYINIPYYQTHHDIDSTLKHIYDVVYYFINIRPELPFELCQHDKMGIDITITENDEQRKEFIIVDYVLDEMGLKITTELGEENLVDYQTFFRLLINETWNVTFDIEDDEKDDDTSELEESVREEEYFENMEESEIE